VAQLQLLRSITASQFTGALAESLKPRLQDTGATRDARDERNVPDTHLNLQYPNLHHPNVHQEHSDA